MCKYIYINLTRPHRRVFWRLADVGGEGDLSFPTKMISLMGHCHGESCALYSRLRCGIGVSPLLPPPFTYREGATVSRALEFMHGSSGLGYFLSFFGSEIPTQYLWTPGTALHRCPPYLVTARLPGALVLEVGNVAGLYSKRTVSRFVSTFVVRKRGVWRNSGIYHGNCWN